MFIVEIYIDGFKSYPTRTVVGPFNSHFNAITGANGSGKSNILDAICFAMGISNLQQVRATGLKDLIYKQGQAGVTKASVTIVFNNEDKEHSPIGYEQCDSIHLMRQIQVGGASKFMINGKAADKNKVTSMLHSQQLNINNPHFLIMQGRITKVLNMKPPEILGMVAEAAGTRMYDEKKNQSLRMIEKKQKKLEEIDRLLQEEIMPQLAKLHEERAAYMEYTKTQGEIRTLDNFIIAYQFTEAKNKLEQWSTELQELSDSLKEKEKRRNQLAAVVVDKEAIIAGLRRKHDEEAGAGLRDLEAEAEKLSKALVKATTALDNHRKSKESETVARDQLLQTIQLSEQQKTNQIDAVAQAKHQCEQLHEVHIQSQSSLDALQRRLQAVKAGMDDDQGASFQDMLRDLNLTLSNTTTERKQAEMKLKHAQGDLKSKKPLAQGAEKAHEQTSKQLQVKVKELERLRANVDRVRVDPAQEAALAQEKQALEEEVQHAQYQVDQQSARLNNMQFNYQDPEPNFNRNAVHGLVARLVTIKDPSTVTALEVTAGGKLYNVIVDTQATGAKLLAKGRLQHRVTIIPLNKVAANSISTEKINLAKREVGHNNVTSALSLVGYPHQVERAMQFVFGSTFVCVDPASAQKVTYHPNIKGRCVTLDGDVYEPSGTLSGGSRPTGGSVLTRLQQLKEAEDVLTGLKSKLQAVTAEHVKALEMTQIYHQSTQQLSLKEHELELLNETIQSSSHHQQLQELANLETEIAQLTEIIAESERQEMTCKQRIKELQAKEQQFTSSRDGALALIETEIANQKKAVVLALKSFKGKQREVEKLQAQCEQQILDVASVQKQISDQESILATVAQVIAQEEEKLSAYTKHYNEAKQRLENRKSKMEATDRELEKAIEDLRRANVELEGLQLDLKQAAHRCKRLETECSDAEHTVTHMYEKHRWIADEEQYFGQEGSTYDFTLKDPMQAKTLLGRLKEENNRREKNINMQAMAQSDKKKAESDDLVKKKNTVDNDKEKILSSIAELDKKKEEQLEKTAMVVNAHFGRIYSTLLPGTQAKLEPLEGHSVQDGLEIKVAFGQVWKQSLAELSGGQRSLVALSLILAMLLFKPAPVYILDEVDAALDISHTQNIGKMIRTHFTHSQFIVVSLK
eukprot:Ihof_evm2s336 gene=Ihof_evmTU2s336